MDKLAGLGRGLFGIAITAFGAQHFVCARFGQDVVPVIPWLPGNHPLLAYLVGSCLIVAGLSLQSNAKTQLAAASVAVLLFAGFALLWLRLLIAAPLDLGIRTRAFETLALCAAALMLAGTTESGSSSLERVLPSGILGAIGRYIFAVSSIIFGVDHFYVLSLIASLVPAWLPFHMFWAYFTGTAFIAAGVSIATGWKARWGAGALGLMFGLWFVILHAPRILTAPRSHDPNEWSSAFIALGMCGGSWICARIFAASRAIRFVAARAA